MTRKHLVIALTLGLSAAASLQGCMLDSPTYITETSAQTADSDAGTASPPPTGGGSGSADAGAVCQTNDFAKPDLTKLTACGSGKGHCYDKAKVPMSDQLTACPTATDVCVPDEILAAGGDKLKSCTSIIGAGGCVTASLIPQIIQQGGSALKQDVCDASQLCVPCTDPTHNNAPTPFCQAIGVHQNACAAAPAGGDSGAPPSGSQTCCTTSGQSNGTCISEQGVPASQRDQAPQDTCATGNKCIPTTFLNNTPVNCDVGFLYGNKGVCMDKCFSGMLSFAGNIGLLSKVTCGSTELCIPCAWVSGQGVPSCP